MVPGAVAFSLTGAGLDKILLNSDSFDISSLITNELMLGLIGLGILALLPVFYRLIINTLTRK